MSRSTPLCAALAALSLLPALAVKPASAQPSVPPALIATDIAVTETAARHPLSAQEKAQVIAIDQAQFHREPAWSLATLRREVTDLKNLHRMDAVRLAAWRKSNLVSTYYSRDPHITPDENKVYLTLYTQANPIISADPATQTLICGSDIDAWLAATRTMAAASGVSPASARATVMTLARSPQFSGSLRVKAADMERDWAAYRLCWAHEPAGDRSRALAELVGQVRRGAAKGSGTAAAAGTALVLASDAYGDYPYSLDPRFAVLKPRLERMIVSNTASVMDMMRRENGRIIRNGIQQGKGEDPLPGDESPALPRPSLP